MILSSSWVFFIRVLTALLGSWVSSRAMRDSKRVGSMSKGGIGVGRMEGAGVAQKGSPPRRRCQQSSCEGRSGVHSDNEVQLVNQS